MKELVGAQVLLPAWEHWASTVGFHDGDYHADYSRHADRVLRLTDAMRRELGLKRHDRFGVLGANCHQFLELYHAAFLGGGIINPLNIRLSPREIQLILSDSEVTVVFVDALFAEHLQRAIAPVRDELMVEKVVLIGDGEGLGDLSYEEVLGAGNPVIPAEPAEDDPVVLMYTGGTTGLPKGVLLDQRAEMLNLYHVAMTVDLAPGRVYLHQTPMFHAAAMAGILGIPAIGGVSVFQPIFDPGPVMDLIERYGVDWTVVVPTMLAMLLEHPSFAPERFASMRDIVYGASPMPVRLLERVREALPHVGLWQGYGMTECSSVLTMLTDEDHAAGGARLGSVGRAVLGVQLSVRDEHDEPCEPGRDGEVCARAGNFFSEYWNRPKETAGAFRHGWYHTGDIGHLDEDGFLYLVDRSNDVIVSGGENVYTIEVENALSTYPGVAEVAVIGLPHPTWGEQVHAVVVPAPEVTLSAEALIAHARRSIAGFKVPKSIEFRSDPLPLSGSLKPLKRDLREAALARIGPGGDAPDAGAGQDPDPQVT